MSFEEVGIIYSAKNQSEFLKGIKDTELGLRRQQKAVDDQIQSLQKEAVAIKNTVSPTKERLLAIRQEIEALRLSKAEIASKVQALKIEAAASRQSAAWIKELDVATKGLTGSIGSLIRVFAPLLALFTAGEILKTADAFNQLQGKVKNSLSDVSQFSKVFDDLLASSNRTGQSIDGVAQAFARIRPAAEELGVTNEKLIRFNETFAKMGTLAGATSEEIKNSMIQLSQGLASGALRGDELRSVMEQMPQVARTIASSMGIPFREFKKAAEEGKITAEQVFKAIIAESDKTDEAFNKLPGSIDRSMNRIINAVTLGIGAFNKMINATGFVSKAFDDLAKILFEVANFIDRNAEALGDLLGQFARLINIIYDVNAALFGWNQTVDSGTGALDGFSVTVLGVAGNLDFLITKLESAGIEMARFIEQAGNILNLGTNFTQKITNKDAIDKKYSQRQDVLNSGYQKRTGERIDTVFRMLSGRGGGVAPPRRRPSSDPGKTKKGKKARKPKDKTASIEAKRVSNILRDQKDFEQQLAINYDPANLGSRALELDKLNLKTEELNKVQQKLFETQNKLNNLDVKTKEGKEKKAEALKSLSLEFDQNTLEMKKNQNAIEVYYRELQERNADFSNEMTNQIANGSLEILQGRIKEVADEWKKAYDENKITAEQYYGKLNELSDFYTNAEIANIDRQIDAVQKKIDIINEEIAIKGKSVDVENGNLQALQKELEKLRSERDKTKAAGETTKKGNNDALDQDLGAYAKGLKEQTQQAIAEGISDVLQGNNILDSFKKFATKLKDILINAFADALSKRIVGFFDGLFNQIGGVLNGISGKSGGGAQGSAGGGLASGLSGLLKKGAVGSLVGGAIGYGAGRVTGNKLIGAGSGALSGAAAGFFFGGPVGAAIGGVVGGIAGLFGGGSGKKAKQAQKAAKQEATANALAQKALAGADQNNLLDLNARLSALLGNNKGLRGNAVRIVRDAALQLQALIEARKKAIEDAIKEIDNQNKDLVDSINLIGASAGDAFKINRDAAFRKLAEETQKLLDEFKDSEEAKTKILEQESLKRQLLLKQESETAQGTVQDLQDLLKQRDAAANANVFTRRQSNESVKSEAIKALDQQIAEQFQTLKATLDAGVTPLGTLGLNQITQIMSQLQPVSSNLQVIINEAKDPAYVDEAIQRAFDAFYRKAYGANAA